MTTHLIESRNPRAITLGSGGAPTVLWAADEPGPDGSSREALVLWTAGVDAPAALISDADAIGAPVAAALGDHAVVACAVRRGGRDFELVAFRLRGGAPDGELELARVGQPGRLAACPEGRGVLLCWESWDGIAVGLDGAWIGPGGEVSRERARSLLRGAAGLARSPRLAWDGERAWLAWLRSPRRGARWSIALRALGGAAPDVTVARPGAGTIGGLDLAASGPGVLWIAWHTSRRPGRGPDLTRWVEVRALAAHRLHAPAGAPLRRRWGELGEDQGLEFPVLLPGPAGGVTLFARSAHRHWRFDLDGRGWSSPVAIDEAGWGCRVRRLAAVLAPGSGEPVVAWRHRQSVQLERLAPSARAGAPRLAPEPEEAKPRPRPARAARSAQGLGAWRLCFGDIHQHTAHSDGTGTAREAYERARDEYRDELAAVTDHESFLGKRIGSGEWRQLMAECDLHDEPGRFVTIPGYEWTGARHPGPGHRCVYWPSSDRPVLGREHPEARTSAALVAAVGRRGGLVFPHHVGWTGADAAAHDPAVQTCWEIVSCHGAYEAIGVGPIGQRDVPLQGQFVRDQLGAGLRFGFVGGSDGHGLLWHHGVSRKRDSHRTGLTAVLVRELSRAAVFEALRLRRCYATSGVPIRVWLAVDGAPMGAEVKASGAIRVEAFVDALAPLRAAELVGPAGVVAQLAVAGSTVRAELELPAPPRPGGASFLYLRVEQRDAELAWSSPVWLVD